MNEHKGKDEDEDQEDYFSPPQLSQKLQMRKKISNLPGIANS